MYVKKITLFLTLFFIYFLQNQPAGLAQTRPSDCTRPIKYYSQRDGGTSGDAGGCIRNAKRLNYATSTRISGYLQTLVGYPDHTDVYYYDYGRYLFTELNRYYCVEFTPPLGSPSPINNLLQFDVWKSNYGSYLGLTYAGKVTLSKGFGFYLSKRTRYYFALKLSIKRKGGQYAFKITKKNCGGQAPPPPQLDYEPTSAYKYDSYSGNNGIKNYDGKGVAVLRSYDRIPVGSGPNSARIDGTKFSFVIRSSVLPKYSFDLALHIKGGRLKYWTRRYLKRDYRFRPNSGAKLKYRFYYILTCTQKRGSDNLGPGDNYHYYFTLRYNGKIYYLPPQAARGKYLDAPDCLLTPKEPPPPKEPKPEIIPDENSPSEKISENIDSGADIDGIDADGGISEEKYLENSAENRAERTNEFGPEMESRRDSYSSEGKRESGVSEPRTEDREYSGEPEKTEKIRERATSDEREEKREKKSRELYNTDEKREDRDTTTEKGKESNCPPNCGDNFEDSTLKEILQNDGNSGSPGCQCSGSSFPSLLLWILITLTVLFQIRRRKSLEL